MLGKYIAVEGSFPHLYGKPVYYQLSTHISPAGAGGKDSLRVVGLVHRSTIGR